MDYLLEETVPAAELKKFESRYMNELDTDGKVAAGTQFEYAWCLVRSKYPADIRKGIALLEDLFQVGKSCNTVQSDKTGHQRGMDEASFDVNPLLGPIRSIFRLVQQHLFDDLRLPI